MKMKNKIEGYLGQSLTFKFLVGAKHQSRGCSCRRTRFGQLLFSLPPSYDAIKAAMNASDKDCTWQEAVDILLISQEQAPTHHARRPKSSGDAYTVTTQVNPCFNCQKIGHVANNCLNSCTKCDPSGPSHSRKGCPYFARRSAPARGRTGARAPRGDRGGRRKGTATLAAGNEQAWLHVHQAMLSSNFPSSSAAPLNVLDSGCSIHTISRRQKRISRSQVEPVAVPTASDSVLQLKESGNAWIFIKDGRGNRSTALLNNALISPTLEFNLVSVSKLDEAGFSIQFGNGQAIITQDGIETARGLLNKAGLYTPVSSPSVHACKKPSFICLSSPNQQDQDSLVFHQTQPLRILTLLLFCRFRYYRWLRTPSRPW